MTRPADQLREAFASHEHLAPDADMVYANAQALARAYRRRRTTVRAGGGAVLSAGLVAGVVTAPGLMGSAPTVRSDIGTGGTRTAPTPSALPTASAPAVVPSEPPPPSGAPVDAAAEEERREAFFAGGNDYDDALALAALWNLTSSDGGYDYDAAKSEAGALLLAGRDLPEVPDGVPAAGPSPVAVDPADDTARRAFLAAGYDWDDAVTLARVWNVTDVLQAKARAGRVIQDGESLPIPTPRQ